MDNLQVATAILEQLGGNRFIAMTGAKSFTTSDKSLSFRLPKYEATKINVVRIELNAQDTYDIEFYYARGSNLRLLKQLVGIYAEQLQEVFKEVTGLDTHL